MTCTVTHPRRARTTWTALTSAGDGDEIVRRIAMLESRVEEQNTALRRVLTLLVDWVEADTARAEPLRDTA